MSLPAWERGLKLCYSSICNSVQVWSLPAWERGLKLQIHRLSADAHQSLPAWERGLKLSIELLKIHRAMSLPAWERGLKLDALGSKTRLNGRSPRGSVD